MKLKLQNWGILTGEWEFGPNVLIVGGHESGKSTLLAATQFALLGSVPSVGKDAMARFIGPKGDVATVELTLDDGIAITRTLSVPGKKPTVKTSCWTGERRLIDKVADGFIGARGYRSHFLDMGLLKQMRGDERRQALMSLLPTDPVDAVDSVIAAGEAYIAAEKGLVGWADADEDERKKLWWTLSQGLRQKWDSVCDELRADIESGLAKVSSIATELEQEKRTREQVAKDASSRQEVSSENLALVDQLPSMQAELVTLRQRVADAKSRLAAADSARRESELIEHRKQQIAAAIPALQEKLGTRPTLEKELAQVEQELSVLKAARPSVSNITQELQSVMAELGDAERRRTDALAKAQAAFTEYQQLEAGGAPPCPYIGACNGDLTAYTAENAAKKEKLKALQKSLRVVCESAKEAVAKATSRMEALQVQIRDGQAKESEWHSAVGVAQAKAADLKSKMASLDEAGHQLRSLQEEAARLASVPPPVHIPETEDEAVMSSCVPKIERLEEQVAKGRSASAMVQTISNVTKADDFARPIAMWKGTHKAMLAALSDWQRREVEPHAGRLSACLNDLGVKGTVEIVSEGKTFDIRIRQGSALLTLDALSGSAWLRFCVAVQASMLSDDAHILTMEGAEMGPSCLGKVLEWAKKQAWVMFAISTWVEPKNVHGWSIVKMAEVGDGDVQ